ncbi:MAG: DUF1788 domain-containing protein [Candidatus Eisenbacteria sp.]|nr:DUF1788 domain-containing protein [Candidatus Eisenbacteria bacterium]
MSTTLTGRLNQILPRITSEAFLSSEGIGNEIACYIFDYPAHEELKVREHIEMMMGRLASHHSELRVLHLNLLEVVLAYLEKRGLFDKALKMQAPKGDAAVLRALKGPLAAEKLRDFIAAEHMPADCDLLLLSGVGSVWPMLRAHSLLNCLHTMMGKTPLVMFYPGSFDGTTLRLFGQITTTTSKPGGKPYYRAFILVPGGTEA